MGQKLQLHDVIGPFEAKSNLCHLSDAGGATRSLRFEVDRYWEPGSNEHTRWVRACDELLDVLNMVLCRRTAGENVEDVLASVIHTFCHSEYRMVELLSAPGLESKIEPTLQMLQVVFRAAIYGTLRTWIPRAEVLPPIVRVEIDLATGEVTNESVEYTEMRVPRKYRRFK